MGYYKDQNIDQIQKIFDEEQEALLAEKAAASYLQPYLSQEFSDYPEADSLLDFVKAFNQRKALMAEATHRTAMATSHRAAMATSGRARSANGAAVSVQKAR